MSKRSFSTNGARYAIAVNNIGVELLHKHCYAQAGSTFEDSLRILQAPSNNNFTEFAQDYYQRALERLSRPEPFDCDSNTPPPYMITVITWNNCTSTCYSHQGHILDDEDVQHQGAAPDHKQALPQASESTHTIYPFRMEDVDLSMSIDDGEIDVLSTNVNEFLKVESSIIMHNFGLSFMCLAASNRIPCANAVISSQSISVTPSVVVPAGFFRNTIIAARLLKIAASVWFEESTDNILIRYSLSSTGPYALRYFMKNIQVLLLVQFHPLQHLFSDVAEAILSLSEAFETIKTLLQTIIRWNSIFFPSSSSSMPQNVTDLDPVHVSLSDSVAPAA